MYLPPLSRTNSSIYSRNFPAMFSLLATPLQESVQNSIYNIIILFTILFKILFTISLYSLQSLCYSNVHCLCSHQFRGKKVYFQNTVLPP